MGANIGTPMLTYIRKILESEIYDAVVETPIHRMQWQSRELGNTVLVKREDFQPVFSFKLRGAYNKILKLTPRELRRGIITASAGNHAQGVAYGAQMRGVRAVIVMPVTTPRIKVEAVKARGADVVLHGDNFDQACVRAMRMMRERGLTFIHPYDDPDVIAGQGTIGMEIVRQHISPLHAVFVPVGGGGLIAGIAVYLKYVKPEIKVIGVECEDSACLHAAMRHGRRVTLPHVGIFADGTAVAQIGRETFRLCRKYVDDVLTVTPDEICAAIKDLFDDTRSVAEPAGALGLAGLKKYVKERRVRDQVLLTIESGANVDFARLRYIAERAEIGEHKECILHVRMPEKPGILRAFCLKLPNAEVSLFSYRYSGPGTARFMLGLEADQPEGIVATLQARLGRQRCTIEDLTGNDLAKTHVSHMIGNCGAEIRDEVVYEIEFPERKGALLDFLAGIADRWNISLFHYRKIGGAYGKVLLGLQVPRAERSALLAALKAMHYRFEDQTGNPAYIGFLKPSLH